MAKKRTYGVFQRPVNIHRNRSFQIIGVIREKYRDAKFTRLNVETTGWEKSREKVETFPVYFRGESKSLVDRYTQKGYLVNITGHMVRGKNSTDTQIVIVLEGKQVDVFKNFVSVYEDAKPVYVQPKNMKDADDLAY